jgi:hypothetical protein
MCWYIVAPKWPLLFLTKWIGCSKRYILICQIHSGSRHRVNRLSPTSLTRKRRTELEVLSSIVYLLGRGQQFSFGHPSILSTFFPSVPISLMIIIPTQQWNALLGLQVQDKLLLIKPLPSFSTALHSSPWGLSCCLKRKAARMTRTRLQFAGLRMLRSPLGNVCGIYRSASALGWVRALRTLPQLPHL